MTQFLDQIPEAFYTVFIGISAFIENVFPPYPGDTFIVVGGALVASGKINIYGLYLSILIGNLSGALLMFTLGSHVIEFLRRVFGKTKIGDFLSPENLKSSEIWFRKYGFWAVVFSRFSAGVRFFVAIVAGLSKMNIISFTIAFTIATLLWNSLLIYAGYVLGDNWNKVIEFINVYNIIVMGILIPILLAFIAYKMFRKKKDKKEMEN